MVIKQCGASMARIIPLIKTKNNVKLTDIFNIIRPHINLDFQSICSQIMSVFVLSTKSELKTNSNINENKSSLVLHESLPIEKENGTRFKGNIRFKKCNYINISLMKSFNDTKGQMVYIKEKELILFQCSPSVMSIDDLIS
jgi:guanylate cyclase soluble subunit beta